MDISSRSSRQDEMLQETAARLIDAVGIDSAIFVCRSNYWHGVLRLVLERRKKPRLVITDHSRSDRSDRLDSPRQSAILRESPEVLPVAA